MDTKERLQLDKLIRVNNVEDVTQDIKDRKHSALIRDDITAMMVLKRQYSRLAQTNRKQFDMMLENKCMFLFNNYTDIFNRVKKDELNLDIMWQFLEVLRNIEDGTVDQHEGAYHVGKLLKEIYIDSAKTRADRLDELASKRKKNTTKRPELSKNITWNDYKFMTKNDNN